MGYYIGFSNGKEYFTWDKAIDIAESMHSKLPSVEDIKEAIAISLEIFIDDKKALLCREIRIPFNGYGWHIGGTYSLICDGTHGFIWTSDIQDKDNAISFFCTSNSWGFCAIPKKTKCNIILCENGTSGN